MRKIVVTKFTEWDGKSEGKNYDYINGTKILENTGTDNHKIRLNILSAFKICYNRQIIKPVRND